jgi:hypothetical protein
VKMERFLMTSMRSRMETKWVTRFRWREWNQIYLIIESRRERSDQCGDDDKKRASRFRCCSFRRFLIKSEFRKLRSFRKRKEKAFPINMD